MVFQFLPVPAMKKTLTLLALVALAGCTCNKSSAPVPDVPPTSFPDSGLVIDQPKDGETVTGQWVAVTGWVDPSRFNQVVVIGAPAVSFYQLGGGHLGPSTATLAITDGGHFYAPRVPLNEGATTILVAPVPNGDSDRTATTLNLTGQGTTTVPMTAVATPEGGNAPLTVQWRAAFASGSAPVQWDFDGDGVFDAEGQSASHTYSQPGQYWVMARAQVDGRWLYAVGRIAVTEDSTVTQEAAVGANAHLLTVLNAGTSETTDEFAATAEVLVATDRGIEIFDAKLNPVRTLAVSGPVRGLTADNFGRIYVASDHQVVRYLGDGTLDSSFGRGAGAFAPDGGFGQLAAFCLGSRIYALGDGDAGEMTSALAIDNGVLQHCDSRADCSPAGSYAEGTLTGLRCTHAGGSNLQGVATNVSGDVIDSAMNPMKLFGTSGLSDVVLCSYGQSPYYAGVGPGGQLTEWRLLPLPARKSKLPFTATTVACDPIATLIRTRTLPEPSGMAQLPVLYVAGSGKLQRRALKEISP